MSNSTTYTVSNIEGTFYKKSKAIEAAEANKGSEPIEVITNKGTIVHVVAPVKKIKMSAPYTRVVPVPAEVAETINGKRVAYKRTRVGFALLDASKGDYTIFDLVRGVEVGEVEVSTTREAGRWFADEAPALRASLA